MNESEKQFSFTRAALSTGGRAKSKFLCSIWPETPVFGRGAGRRDQLQGGQLLIFRVATLKPPKSASSSDTAPVGLG
jgi:hypothetical protein